MNHLCWSQKKIGHTLTLVSAPVHISSDVLKTFNRLQDERTNLWEKLRSWNESTSYKPGVDFINISVIGVKKKKMIKDILH